MEKHRIKYATAWYVKRTNHVYIFADEELSKLPKSAVLIATCKGGGKRTVERFLKLVEPYFISTEEM